MYICLLSVFINVFNEHTTKEYRDPDNRFFSVEYVIDCKEICTDGFHYVHRYVTINQNLRRIRKLYEHTDTIINRFPNNVNTI